MVIIIAIKYTKRQFRKIPDRNVAKIRLPHPGNIRTDGIADPGFYKDESTFQRLGKVTPGCGKGCDLGMMNGKDAVRNLSWRAGNDIAGKLRFF